MAMAHLQRPPAVSSRGQSQSDDRKGGVALNRITRWQAFMQTAEVWSRRSTCMRRNVGAVIAVNDRIVSVGYNGAPPGEPHCDGKTCIPPGCIGCARAVHAEINAIKYLPSEMIK